MVPPRKPLPGRELLAVTRRNSRSRGRRSSRRNSRSLSGGEPLRARALPLGLPPARAVAAREPLAVRLLVQDGAPDSLDDGLLRDPVPRDAQRHEGPRLRARQMPDLRDPLLDERRGERRSCDVCDALHDLSSASGCTAPRVHTAFGPGAEARDFACT